MTDAVKSKLALLGGEKAIKTDLGDMIKWPIVTKEHEDATLEVLRAGAMSGRDITKKFEEEYAAHLGAKYALGFNNGTAALQAALYGMGVGVGDEVIVPSVTYWASAMPVYSLGGSIVFADIREEDLCIDPEDIKKRITPRTKAIIVVHYAAMPADMDAIMAIAEEHNIKVLEDCSHSHGTLYKGKETGTLGHAAGMSMMSGKAFATGEAGMMFTDDQRIYERAILFGHYARHNEIELEDLKAMTEIPTGGYKYRMHQLSAAFGRVQLKLYPAQMAEIDKAMNYLYDLIEGTPGIRTIRPAKDSGSTRGGWYVPFTGYTPEELGGLSVTKFVEALKAEGMKNVSPGSNTPLHKHPVFSKTDIYGHGKPTQIANLPEGTVQPSDPLPVSETICERVIYLPWFKHYRPQLIEENAEAIKKVAANFQDLLDADQSKGKAGGYSTFSRS